jgi:hypothetical protein
MDGLQNITATFTFTETGSAASITQRGITWHFDQNYPYGQFANGDYWVMDPGTGVNLVNITTTDGAFNYEGTDYDIIGVTSTLNPRWGSQGYIETGYHYDDSQSFNPPGVLQPGDTLISGSRINGMPEHPVEMYSAEILTVVSAAQGPDKFRPPYGRPVRYSDTASDPLLFSTNQIDWNLLPGLDQPNQGENVPALASTISLFERPIIDHMGTSLCNTVRPLSHTTLYGREFATPISEAAMQICLDYSRQEIEPLVIKLIQTGIDYYGLVQDDGEWHPDGGWNHGRKFPILFAAMILNDDDMKNVSRTYGEHDEYRFQEDGQTYYYDAPELPDYVYYDENRVMRITTDPAHPGAYEVRGVKGAIDILNGGDGDIALWRISHQPVIEEGRNYSCHEHWRFDEDIADNSCCGNKGESYRICCTSNRWVGQALAMRIMSPEFIQVWDHDAYFDYVLRWMTQDYTNAQTLFNSFQAPDQIGNAQMTSGSNFIDDMWAAYAGTYFTVLRSE